MTLQSVMEPSELLEFEYCIKRVDLTQVDHLELSVVWVTEGKGSEDIGVHLFENVSGEQLSRSNLESATLVQTQLPASPLSYEGKLFRLRWCVRLRLFLNDGREITAEQPFYLGHLTREV